MAPLVGGYSTETHPFGLVYEHMDNLDLRQYLKNEPNVERVKLVLDTVNPLYQLSDVSRQQLTGIAQFLKRMHDLNIVHGDLRTVRLFYVS